MGLDTSPGSLDPSRRAWDETALIVGRHPQRHCRCAMERSEEHTSELQSRLHLVCRLLLEKKKNTPAPKSTPPRSSPNPIGTPLHGTTTSTPHPRTTSMLQRSTHARSAA